MAKDINTNSKEWCDLVFENKNKKYGAYRMRLTSSKRHILAFLFVTLTAIFFMFLPALIEMAEFYIFQHTDSDYVLEDYDFITDNLTEVELLQLSKQFIPDASKTEKKSTQSEVPTLTAEEIKSRMPVIVDDSLINESYIRELQADTASAKKATESEEKEAETEPDDGLYTIVEEMPAFPGGEQGLMDYIYKNLRYPFTAADKKIENCVICTFIIDTKGAVTQVEITQSAHPLLDKEAMRIVKSLPQWRPARQHGKLVRVKYTLPIIFRLK